MLPVARLQPVLYVACRIPCQMLLCGSGPCECRRSVWRGFPSCWHTRSTHLRCASMCVGSPSSAAWRYTTAIASRSPARYCRTWPCRWLRHGLGQLGYAPTCFVMAPMVDWRRGRVILDEAIFNALVLLLLLRPTQCLPVAKLPRNFLGFSGGAICRRGRLARGALPRFLGRARGYFSSGRVRDGSLRLCVGWCLHVRHNCRV
jgi:hypothetical protein